MAHLGMPLVVRVKVRALFATFTAFIIVTLASLLLFGELILSHDTFLAVMAEHSSYVLVPLA